MHKYGQNANNFSKTITFQNSYVKKTSNWVVMWSFRTLTEK